MPWRAALLPPRECDHMALSRGHKAVRACFAAARLPRARSSCPPDAAMLGEGAQSRCALARKCVPRRSWPISHRSRARHSVNTLRWMQPAGTWRRQCPRTPTAHCRKGANFQSVLTNCLRPSSALRIILRVRMVTPSDILTVLVLSAPIENGRKTEQNGGSEWARTGVEGETPIPFPIPLPSTTDVPLHRDPGFGSCPPSVRCPLPRGTCLARPAAGGAWYAPCASRAGGGRLGPRATPCGWPACAVAPSARIAAFCFRPRHSNHAAAQPAYPCRA
jgi:hypothetical protein